MRDRGATQTIVAGNHRGMLQEGNINLLGRPIVHNKDGSISTVLSFSKNIDGKEVLLPQVVHGKVLSIARALAHFQQTGEHLGMFVNAKAADRYAQLLHVAQANMYGG